MSRTEKTWEKLEARAHPIDSDWKLRLSAIGREMKICREHKSNEVPICTKRKAMVRSAEGSRE